MKISKSKLTIFHEKAKLLFIQKQRYFLFQWKRKKYSFLLNFVFRSCAALGTKMRRNAHLWKHVLFFYFFWAEPPCCKRGRDMPRGDGNFPPVYKWRVFWSYYSPASGSGPISGKRSVSGGVSSSMRRLQLRHGKLRGRRKGVKKEKSKKEGEREGQLDKNRRVKVTKSGG